MTVYHSGVASISRWLKPKTIFLVISSILLIVASVEFLPPAWERFSEAVGIPKCLIYGTTYYYSAGYFHELQDSWVQHNDTNSKFSELYRDRQYITLAGRTPEGAPSATIIRIPVCGGTLQWSYRNPQRWVDLYEVWR